MAKQWYVVHTYSGYEEKVKKALEDRIRLYKMEDYFDEIIIPKETVMEVVKGKRKLSEKKVFPGYLLIKMEMNEKTWQLVRGTPRVAGFIGGKNPKPIPEEEAQNILKQLEEGSYKPRPKVTFEPGDTVKIIDGPFANIVGVVEEVKPEKGKLKIQVSIFGRVTPVEVDFHQVTRN